jgi:hypothetical protein
MMPDRESLPQTETPRESQAPQAPQVPYLSAPAGRVFATDAAIETLGRTRLWATLAAIVCLGGGGLGVLLGAYVGVLLIFNPAARGEANIVICGGATFYGLMALVAGVMLVRFLLAIRQTHRLRRPDDLERTMTALWCLMLWIAMCLVAALAYPFVVIAVAAWVGAWP